MIYLAKNFLYMERTKHIAVMYNFIREIIADDMLAKTLPKEKFSGCLTRLKVLEA